MKKTVAGLAVFMLLLSGCAHDDESGMNVYYINKDGNGLESKKVQLTDESPVSAAKELIKALQNTDDLPEGTKSVLQSDISIEACSVDDNIMDIDLSGDYGSMDITDKLLLTAGLTKTFVQIEGIDGVNFTIEKEPLLDLEGKEVGTLTADDFVIHMGDEINTYSNIELTLYFTDVTGKLVPEERTVYYSSSVPIEQLVIQELIKGPYEGSHNAIVAPNATFLNVNIQEDICYVNFDESISQAMSGYDADKALKAMVKTLSAACHIDKVQFSVNGDTATKINGIDISKIYEA